MNIQNPREFLAETVEDFFKGVCLFDSAREAVKDKSVLAIVLRQTFANDADSDFVGNEFAGVHASLSLCAELSTFLDCCAEHVSR